MKAIFSVFVLGFGLFAGHAYSATINFSGTLADVTDAGGATYSGVPVGTVFSGNIDDVTFNGSITDGTTETVFGCCIAAGGLGLTNDQVLTADDAASLNFLAGAPLFEADDVIDLVDIEGDTNTAGGGRIEVGLSYILDPGAFDSTDPSNYPFNPGDVLLTLFFIVEENSDDVEIYNAIGVVPLPASAWLLGSALGLLGWLRRRTS